MREGCKGFPKVSAVSARELASDAFGRQPYLCEDFQELISLDDNPICTGIFKDCCNVASDTNNTDILYRTSAGQNSIRSGRACGYSCSKLSWQSSNSCIIACFGVCVWHTSIVPDIIETTHPLRLNSYPSGSVFDWERRLGILHIFACASMYDIYFVCVHRILRMRLLPASSSTIAVWATARPLGADTIRVCKLIAQTSSQTVRGWWCIPSLKIV